MSVEPTGLGPAPPVGCGPGREHATARSMLVVSANWSISDGSVTASSRGRCRDWLAAVHRAAVRAGWRDDGRYAPIDAVDLVFAGDTFDWLTSTAWLTGPRPWDRGPKAATIRARVMLETVKRARPLLGRLARWVRLGMDVPRGDRHQRPALGDMIPIPVRVTLLSGDRDPWLSLAADRAARDGIDVGHVWSSGRVVVAHGAGCDPACLRGDDRAARAETVGRPTLAESVAVDFVARFARDLGQAGSAAAPGLVTALSHAPVSDLPRTFAGWLASTAAGPAARGDRVVVATWRRAVRQWQREARRTGADAALGFDGVEALVSALESAVAGEGPGGEVHCDWLRPGSPAAAVPWPATARPEFVVLGHPPGPLEPTPVGHGAIVRLGGGSDEPARFAARRFRAQRPAPPSVACRRWRGVLAMDVVSPGDAAASGAGIAVAGEAA